MYSHTFLSLVNVQKLNLVVTVNERGQTRTRCVPVSGSLLGHSAPVKNQLLFQLRLMSFHLF